MKRFIMTAGMVCGLSCFVFGLPSRRQPAFPVAWEVTTGVQSPESAYFDAASGFVFVSNVGGGGPTGKDGDGFLSKLTRTAKWSRPSGSPA